MAPPIHITETPWENSFQAYDEIIDVRSPAEFAEDHIPGALNFPVLDNEERRKIGIIYKQISPFEARKIGASLIAKNISQYLECHFLHKIKDYHPLIYCWRGGQRSNSFAAVLSQIGWQTTLIQGGYKTYRNYVREQLDLLAEQLSFKILCGYTGSAKTFLLQKMNQAGIQILDLEKLANHRGSLLGQVWETTPTAQPSQKWFESQLLATLKTFDPSQSIWVESESRLIGKIQIPKLIWQTMRRSPCYEVELPIKERVKLLMAEYPHLIEHPEALKKLLNYLIPNHGKQKIQTWFELIDAKKGEEFVTAILAEHYDPAYRRSLPLSFSEPIQKYKLQDLSQASIKQFVTSINNLSV